MNPLVNNVKQGRHRWVDFAQVCPFPLPYLSKLGADIVLA